jgi:hypothetical protein
MGKAALAKAIANRFGTSVSKARNFVTKAGPQRARALLRSSDEVANSGRSFPWKTAIAGTVATGAGGGALYWREQDIKRVEAMAEEAESYEEAVSTIIGSDLPPELKAKLADQAANVATRDRPDTGGGDWLPFDIPNPTDDIGTMVISLVIIVLVVNALLEDQL